MPALRIDIVLDVICPWCFIGKRRLEKALAMRPEIEPQFSWRPFQLNPDMPQNGMARHGISRARNSAAASMPAASTRPSTDAGATVGIPFAFERIRRTPATREAHRLVRHADALGQADALVEALFRAYFIDGRDLGEPRVLAEIAGEAGLDAAEARRFLAGERGARRNAGRGARRAPHRHQRRALLHLRRSNTRSRARRSPSSSCRCSISRSTAHARRSRDASAKSSDRTEPPA